MVEVRAGVEVGPSEAVPSGCEFVTGSVSEERWAVPVCTAVWEGVRGLLGVKGLWEPVETEVGVRLVALAVGVYGLGECVET